MQAPPAIELALRKLARAVSKGQRGGTARAAIVGGVTGDGDFIAPSVMQRQGVHLVQGDNGARVAISAKAIEDAVNSDGMTPRHLDEMADPFNYDADSTIKPPWDFNVLTTLLVENTWHSACIETKAADYAYNRHQLFVTDWARKNVSDAVLEQAHREVTTFLQTAYCGRAIEDLTRDVAVDYESLGTAGFEILRNKVGRITGLSQVPFMDVRFLKKSFVDRTGARFLQRKYNKRVYFVGFNDTVSYTDKSGKPFDPTYAAPEDFPEYNARIGHILRNPVQVDCRTAEETNNFDVSASEMFVMSRPPFTQSRVYGTPAGISAYKAMIAQQKIDQYNISFFAAQGVPQYAVVFEKLSDGSDDDDLDGDDEEMTPADTAQLQETIRAYFKKELSSGNRSILILTLTGESTVRFERLSNETLEASFEEYEKRCRDKVRIAHRVPSAALGIDVSSSGIGGNRELVQMRRYRDHIVSPGQRLVENVINAVIRCGMMIPYFDFRFMPMNLEEEAQRREFALQEYKEGGITLDEYREATGRAALPDGKGAVIILRSTNLTMIGADPKGGQQQIRNTIGYEKAFRRLLTGEQLLDNADDLEEDMMKLADEHGLEDEDAPEIVRQRRAQARNKGQGNPAEEEQPGTQGDGEEERRRQAQSKTREKPKTPPAAAKQ